MADSTLSNLTSLTLPSQATDLLLVGRGTARPNKVAMSDALNSAALAATTGAYGVVQLAASGGTTAGTVVQATDARLSDTRNPPDGSKGDIVVSGSGSTWTIKTDPTLSGNVTATGNVFSSGTRGFSRYKSANGTIASPVEDRIVGFSNTNGLLFDVGMFAANSLTDNSSVWLRFKALDSIGNPQIGLTVTSDTVTLSPTGSGQVVIANNSGAGTATRLTISQPGIRLWYIENTATTGTLAFGDGAGEYLRVIGSANGSFLFGTTINSGNGRLQLVTHSTSAGGIGFGTDVSLFRAGAGILDIRSASTPGTTARLDLNGSTTAGIGFRQTGSRDWFINAEAFELRVSCLTAGSIFAVNNGTPMAVRDTTISTATNSGALVVTGGVGIGGVINAGSGTHTFGNAAATGQLRVQRITTNPSSITLNAVASFPNIDLGSEGGGFTFGAIQSNSVEILRVHNANLAQITNVSGGGLAIGGGLRVSAQTASVGIASGAAVIAGGVGIAGDTYIGGNLVAGSIVDPPITGTILEDIFTITDAAAFEVDPGNGSIQLITLGASRTPKATNFAAGESITLMVNDGTAYTLTWTDATWGTGGVAWVGGSAPTLATTGYTVIQFWKVGTQVYGARVGDVA